MPYSRYNPIQETFCEDSVQDEAKHFVSVLFSAWLQTVDTSLSAVPSETHPQNLLSVTSAQWTLYVSHISCIQFFHYWKWLIFFNCFDSGEEVDIWRKHFSRLPIRTIVNPVVKSTVVFSSTLSRADHIDQSRKLQTEKKMNECFPTVVCDYTLMISWVSLFCYRNSFCNGCR